jgi:hypothetical protein
MVQERLAYQIHARGSSRFQRLAVSLLSGFASGSTNPMIDSLGSSTDYSRGPANVGLDVEEGVVDTISLLQLSLHSESLLLDFAMISGAIEVSIGFPGQSLRSYCVGCLRLSSF